MSSYIYDFVGDTPKVIREKLVNPGDKDIEFPEPVINGDFTPTPQSADYIAPAKAHEGE